MMAADVPAPAPAPVENVNVVIDGKTYQLPKGMNLLEACQKVGIAIPFFCYHPGLSSPAVCRQCLVEIKGSPKPVPSCYTAVADKMEVTTNSPKVLEVRRQMLEFTLLNHPIDCPICDKAGECSLQRHYFDWDAKLARNEGDKVRKAKVVDIGKHIVLDQERCILCTRCIRVCNELAKAPDLTMAYRGNHEILTTAPGRRLDNPYSINTVDVCPVGALTSKDFRFNRRVWELFSSPSICPGCATGCNVEVHSSRDRIYRLVPRENLEVNRFWMCDDGRFEYKAVHQNRVLLALVGKQPARLEAAVAEAARVLREAHLAEPKSVGVLLSYQATNEDTHALLRLAEGLATERIYAAGRPAGWADDILVSADKNPNTTGVQRMTPRPPATLEQLNADVAAGALKALIVVGNEALVLPEGKVEAVVALAWHGGALVDAAHATLPIGMWAEVDGTFTNRTGRVQRICPAVPLPGKSLPGWQAVGLLATKLGIELGHRTAGDVFDEAAARYPFMKGAVWGGPPPQPIQLRFGQSRG